MPASSRLRPTHRPFRAFVALFCAVLLARGGGTALAQEKAPAPQASPATQAAAAPQGAPAPGATPEKPPDKIPPEQLDSLVAPIALYPDPLLAQTLVASTYPLEIIQLQQWLAKNKNLKDKALADAVAKQPWDPSIQSMAAVPDVVKRLADDIQWTTDLGNAFLDQQSEVMDAVQRMRRKAQETGALMTSEQQKVETKVVEQKTVIIVEPADPQVIYVPSYNPVVVYGPPVYPYPPVYYPPPPPPGAMFVAFGVGMAMGAAWGGSCCGCGWGGNNVNINVNNNFNRNVNVGGGGGGNWQHNAQHRGGAPYSNKATANKYGGSTRGASASTRQASAGTSNRAGGAPGGAGVSNRAGGSPGGAGGAGVSNRAAGGGGDQIGNRSVPSSGGSKGSSAFGGGAGGYSGSSARASSSRGASSMASSGGGSRGGGGGSRGGGGGRGGGGRR